MLGKKLGIDLGTHTVRLVSRGEAGMITAPSVVAMAGNGWECVDIGLRAAEIAVERSGIRLVRPIDGALVADRPGLEGLVATLISRATGRQRIFKPDVVATVSPAMVGSDRRAVLDALFRAGAKTAYLIDTPLAAAIGSGLRVAGPEGSFVLDVGAGTVEASVLASEARLAGSTSSRAGRELRDAVAAAAVSLAGEGLDAGAADVLATECATLVDEAPPRRVTVSTSSGAQLSVSAGDLLPVVRGWADGVAATAAATLEDTPAPILAALRRSGGTVTGGCAAIPGLGRYLAAAIGVPMHVASGAEGATLRGCVASLDNLDLLKRNLLYVR